jgi:hypothetical protein
MKYIAYFLFVGMCVGVTVDNFKIKVYLVTSVYDYQRVVHKIYLRKDKAQKYIDQFKEHHNYSLEEMDVE